MLISICKSKIHRATVTTKDLDYIGSITIDSDLMKRADLIPFEKVQVANISTGARFETYVIEGKPGSGEIGINGKGDITIVAHQGTIQVQNSAGSVNVSEISGNVSVQDGCELGAGTTIAPGTTIGPWSIVGAGAVVIESIDSNLTVVGNPARIVKVRADDWQYD